MHAVQVYAFSSENWTRNSHEVALLLQLIEGSIQANLLELHGSNVCLSFMGDRASLPQSLRRCMHMWV